MLSKYFDAYTLKIIFMLSIIVIQHIVEKVSKLRAIDKTKIKAVTILERNVVYLFSCAENLNAGLNPV